MRQLDGCGTVFARIGNAGIKKELVAADNRIAGEDSNSFENKARQLVGSRSVDDVRVIDADENHELDPESAAFVRCLCKWKKQKAPIKPAAAPQSE